MSEIKKYGYIDALRGIAILLVIMVHAAQHFSEPSGEATFLSTKGQYGVQLFFVTSALTLFLSFGQRLKVDQGNTVKFFLIRRFFRIAPAYYLAIIFYSVLLVLDPIKTAPNPISISNVVLSIFFVNGFFPASINYIPPGGWSVAIEMIFYFLIPFFFSRIRSLYASIFWFVGTILLSIIVNAIAGYMIKNYTSLDFEHEKIWYLYFWLPNQLPVFMLGIVLFHLLKRGYAVSQMLGYTIVALSVAAMIGIFYAIPAYQLQGIIPEHIVVGIMFVLIVFAMSQSQLVLLENRFTRFIGKLSFSMYIWHFIVLKSLAYLIRRTIDADWNVQLWILYVTGIAATAAVSALSYEKIELAGVRVGKRIIEKITSNNTVKPTTVDVINR
jgi:peptidoglycan/LPS O-acetylase OafA/YrhL